MLVCEQSFQQSSTAQQNSHCLRNFDLCEYRQILSDLAVWIFQGLVKLNGALIHSLIGEFSAIAYNLVNMVDTQCICDHYVCFMLLFLLM